MGLEGDALLWFQWEHGRRPITRWREMKDLLLRRFRARRVGSLCEQLLSVVQEGSVEEYSKRFVLMATPLKNVDEDMLLVVFIKGLDERIRTELRLLGPSDFEQALDWVVKIEEKLISHYGPLSISAGPSTSHNPRPINQIVRIQPYKNQTHSLNPPPNYPHNPTQNYPSAPKLSPYPNTNPVPKKSNIRRLSDREFQEKREKGLCFKCDDKWHLGTFARSRNLISSFVMMMSCMWRKLWRKRRWRLLGHLRLQ